MNARVQVPSPGAIGRSDIEAWQPVAPEDLRYLTAVVEVVLHHVPHDPASVMRSIRSLDRDVQLLGVPASKAVVHGGPRSPEPVHEFLDAPGMVLVVFPSGIFQRETWNGRALDAEEVPGQWVAFAKHVVEPIRARAGDVPGQLPDRPLMGSGPKVELFRGESPECIDDQCLVLGPSLVEGSQGGDGHATSVSIGSRGQMALS
jgi:hypothetical protein